MAEFTRASVAVATMIAIGATGTAFITQTTLSSPAAAQERKEFRVSGGPERRADRRGGGRRGMMRDLARQADASEEDAPGEGGGVREFVMWCGRDQGRFEYGKKRGSDRGARHRDHQDRVHHR